MKTYSRNFQTESGGKTQSQSRSQQAQGFDNSHPPILNHPDEATFEGFKQRVLSKWIEGSGIDPDRAAKIKFLKEIEYGLGGEPIGTPIHDLLGWKYSRFGRSAHVLPLFAAVYRDDRGEVFQLRLNQGFWDAEKGRYSKPYKFPKGCGSPLYEAVPIDGAAKQWVLTEGGKKAESTASYGFRSFSLTGFRGGYNTDKVTKIKSLTPAMKRLVKNLLEVEGHPHLVIALDRDDDPKKVRDVERAIGIMARLIQSEIVALIECSIESAKNRVRVATWSGALGKGIDDCIVALKASGQDVNEWLDRTIAKAPTYKDWWKNRHSDEMFQVVQKLNSLSIEPDTVTQGEYIPDLPSIELGAINLIDASANSGKSTAIRRDWLGESGFTVVFCPLVSLGVDSQVLEWFPQWGSVRVIRVTQFGKKSGNSR